MGSSLSVAESTWEQLGSLSAMSVWDATLQRLFAFERMNPVIKYLEYSIVEEGYKRKMKAAKPKPYIVGFKDKEVFLMHGKVDDERLLEVAIRVGMDDHMEEELIDLKDYVCDRLLTDALEHVPEEDDQQYEQERRRIKKRIHVLVEEYVEFLTEHMVSLGNDNGVDGVITFIHDTAKHNTSIELEPTKWDDRMEWENQTKVPLPPQHAV